MRKPDYDGGLGFAGGSLPGRQQLTPTAAMQLLAGADYGRVVFTLNALPAIRPVNHLIDEGRIIIRTRLTAAIDAVVRRGRPDVVVAYEADAFDSPTQTGWSVVVTGRAHTIDAPDQITRYEQLLHPWVNHADSVLAIDPDLVSGFRITRARPPHPTT